MAAERAAELSDKKVVVVPTRSQQAGLAAAVALDPTAAPTRTARRCSTALAHVRTGAVTEAARDDAEGRPRASTAATRSASSTSGSSPGASRPRRSRRCSASSGARRELLTLIAGDGAPLDDDAVAALVPAGVELEYSWGGQPAYWWLIAAE